MRGKTPFRCVLPHNKEQLQNYMVKISRCQYPLIEPYIGKQSPTKLLADIN